MHESILTIAMLVFVIMICMLYCACFVFPVVIAGIGISDVKKQRKKATNFNKYFLAKLLTNKPFLLLINLYCPKPLWEHLR